jgi:hypothetical protein
LTNFGSKYGGRLKQRPGDGREALDDPDDLLAAGALVYALVLSGQFGGRPPGPAQLLLPPVGQQPDAQLRRGGYESGRRRGLPGQAQRGQFLAGPQHILGGHTEQFGDPARLDVPVADEHPVGPLGQLAHSERRERMVRPRVRHAAP